MKHALKIGFGVASLVALTSSALAAPIDWGTDITVFDNGITGTTTGWGPYGKNGSWGVGNDASFVDPRSNILYPANGRDPNLPDIRVLEDNEVEPDSAIGQEWDTEGLFYKTGLVLTDFVNPVHKYLTIVGGFNPGGYGGFFPGDIFLDIDGIITQNDTGPAPIPDRPDDRYRVTLNPYGYEYVIHFDNFTSPGGSPAVGTTYNDAGITQAGVVNGQSYTIYQIDANSKLLSAKYNENDHADPFRLIGDAVRAVGTGVASVQLNINNADSGFAGGGTGDFALRNLHHAVTVDITTLLAGLGRDTFGGHVTMGCGNDEILGYRQGGSSVLPDGGATLLLLGGGLTGIGLLARRNRKA